MYRIYGFSVFAQTDRTLFPDRKDFHKRTHKSLQEKPKCPTRVYKETKMFTREPESTKRTHKSSQETTQESAITKLQTSTELSQARLLSTTLMSRKHGAQESQLADALCSASCGSCPSLSSPSCPRGIFPMLRLILVLLLV